MCILKHFDKDWSDVNNYLVKEVYNQFHFISMDRNPNILQLFVLPQCGWMVDFPSHQLEWDLSHSESNAAECLYMYTVCVQANTLRWQLFAHSFFAVLWSWTFYLYLIFCDQQICMHDDIHDLFNHVIYVWGYKILHFCPNRKKF